MKKQAYTVLRLTLVSCCLAFMVSNVNADITEVKDVVKKAFDVREGGTLHLDMDHGNIEVESTSGSRVLVEFTRIADARDSDEAERMFEMHEISFNQDGADVSLRSRYDDDNSGFWNRWRSKNKLKVSARILVPQRYNVEFVSGAGNVAIADIEGTVDGKTGAGNIALEDIRGRVDVTSGAGNVDIAGGLTKARVNTGAGNINVRGVNGAIKAHTGAGNVYAEILGQPEQASSLQSGAGNVTVRLDENVSVYVDATAGMGSCDTNFPLKVEGKWMKKSFSGQINGGGPELRLSAGVGNVTLKKY